MATTANSVVAFFTNESKAAEAIDALQAAGFHAREIGAATNAGYGSTSSASYGTGTGSTSTSHSTAGSTAGAKAEGVWDKVKNFFEGGDNTEGGVEQYADERARDNSTHEITRGGYASGYDYEAGDVSHSLSGMSIPEDRSRYFENQFANGRSGVLVTVTPSVGRESEAERILEQHGGDLGNNTASYAATATATPTQDVTAAGQQRIQLLGEVLRVHKDRISRGEVRIRKEVVTEQQTIQVPVTREELVIERIPVTGQTTPAGTIGDSNEIRIPLTEERASAEKQTLVREEVAVGKRAVEEVREVGGAVRHEELQVEDETGTVGSSGTTRKL